MAAPSHGVSYAPDHLTHDPLVVPSHDVIRYLKTWTRCEQVSRFRSYTYSEPSLNLTDENQTIVDNGIMMNSTTFTSTTAFWQLANHFKEYTPHERITAGR
jgi:hypothetical protein